MNIGRLDRRVTISERQSTVDTQNHPTTSYVSRGEFWARVDYISGSHTEGGDQVVQVERVKFTVRYNRNFTNTDKITYNGDDYDIISLTELGRGEATVFVTTTRNNGSI